jgi:hypothetical protein
MAARLGNVLYWLGCIVAVGWFALAMVPVVTTIAGMEPLAANTPAALWVGVGLHGPPLRVCPKPSSRLFCCFMKEALKRS